MHVPGACGEVSVPLPADFADELAFYRLVNWSYIVLNEAAKLPIAFLISLPPLQDKAELRIEVGRMRTFVAHNLDVTSPSDLKTRSFAHAWFRAACGVGTPMNSTQFAKCSESLGQKLDRALQGAIEACDALDNPDGGPALVRDLEDRINLHWEAHRFDPLVAEVAEALGNPGLDLLEIRRRNLDAWRKTLALADEEHRERALRLRIEATFVAAIADTLPITALEVSRRLSITGPRALSAALVLLRDARRSSPATIGEIIEQVGGSVLGR